VTRVRKKIVSWSVVTLFALTLAFTGCGKKEEAAPPTPAPSASTTPASGGTGEPGAIAPAGGEATPAAPAEAKPQEKKAEGAKTK